MSVRRNKMERFIITDQTGCQINVSYKNMLKIVADLARRGEKFSVIPADK